MIYELIQETRGLLSARFAVRSGSETRGRASFASSTVSPTHSEWDGELLGEGFGSFGRMAR